MPVDLDKIRALLASVAGFTRGPWEHVNKATAHVLSPDCVVHRIEPKDWAATPGSRPRWIADASLIAAAPDLHSHLAEAVGEIERLRAHNARMVALLSKIADAMDAADREPTWSDRMIVVTDSLPDAPDLRRLAAGEVDDG